MKIEVRIPDATAETVLDLHEWLAAQGTVRRHGQLELQPGGGTTHMGTALDVVTLVLGSGLQAAQLVLAVAQWRQSRPAPPSVLITRTGPDGVTLTIETSDAAHLENVVRILDAG